MMLDNGNSNTHGALPVLDAIHDENKQLKFNTSVPSENKSTLKCSLPRTDANRRGLLALRLGQIWQLGEIVVLDGAAYTKVPVEQSLLHFT